MHLNYYFLRKLIPKLSEILPGSRLAAAFSQDKDEIILEFDAGDTTIATLRAILKPDFTSLYFPQTFERARSNSVDLFKGLTGQSVVSISLYENERAFSIGFASGEKMVFKLFGNRSNLLHYNASGGILSIFNNRLSSDLNLDEAKLSKSLDQSFEQFVASGGDFKKMFPTFGKLVNQYISESITDSMPLTEQWALIQSVLSQLDNGEFYLTLFEGVTTLSLLETGVIQKRYDDPIEALNAFCLTYFKVGHLQKEKEQAAKRLSKNILQTESYLDHAYEKLSRISDTGKNEMYANLLMANLHQIPPRADFVELESFYSSETVRIKLKPDLSPAKNAEGYFRKAKNEKQEIAQLQENIEAREADLALRKNWLEELDSFSSVKELRLFLKQNGISGQPVSQALQADAKFKKDTYLGFDIFIGRNAKNNDELTLKFAGKEDLWLHAKDVSGSHVIIRHIPGKTIPPLVIEHAAELAAWNSKRRNDSLCPVTVTPKKFVRKSKGMAAGAVIVERESVIMVAPKEK